MFDCERVAEVWPKVTPRKADSLNYNPKYPTQNVGHIFSKGPRIEAENKGQRKLLTTVPGPGAYEDRYSVLKQKQPRTVFGKSRKMAAQAKAKARVPGVGTYDTSLYDIRRSKKGYSLGRSHRFKHPLVSKASRPGISSSASCPISSADALQREFPV